MVVAPLENLRGDYAHMASDWTVAQHVADYSDEDRSVWRLLVERQTALASVHACDEFLNPYFPDEPLNWPAPNPFEP